MIHVNGRPYADSARRLSELMSQLGHSVDQPGIAAAVNGEVVPRGDWSQRLLHDGDEVEIVGAVQGG